MTAALPTYRMRAVHLTAVWAFGVSQPIFSLLGRNEELLVMRDVTKVEVLGLALVLMLLVPLGVLAYVWIAGRFSRWVGDALYLVVLGGFLVPCALQLVGRLGIGRRDAAFLVAALCVAGVVSYARLRAVRLFVGFAALLPLLGLISFMRISTVQSAEAAATSMRASTPHPIVMLVFDEFPIASLLTSDGRIDGTRFPNFGRLARDATWYPNATTVHEYTTEAVPAMLTGRVPRNNEFPAHFDYPNNLFSSLERSYARHVFEASTKLCPEEYCPENHLSFEERLGGLASDISFLYMNYIVPESLTGDVLRNEQIRHFRRFREGRRGTLGSFLGSLDGIDARSLHYIHLLLPHIPWIYLPSGAQYQSSATEGLRPNETWSDDPWLVQQGLQRHLLQLGYTDRLLGEILDGLVRSGRYDDTLVVVVADHGTAFRAGEARRRPDLENFAEIVNVPVFVKYPMQGTGTVDRRLVRSVDILPTIADVIGAQIPWQVEGTSLLDAPVARSRIVVRRTYGPPVAASLQVLRAGTMAAVRRRVAVLGEGRDSLYRIGTHLSLLGTKPSSWVEEESTTRVELYSEELYDRVETSSSFLPTRVSGAVVNGQIAARTELAIAVNGRIRALTKASGEPGNQVFRALVPESSLKDGFNRVDVFAIDSSGPQLRLVRLGGNTDSP